MSLPIRWRDWKICVCCTTRSRPTETRAWPGTACVSRCSPPPNSWLIEESIMERRNFLRTMGLATGALMFGSTIRPKLARAVNNERSFVFCYFRGGWDTLMSLDPRDPSVFIEDRVGATRIQLGWDRIPANYPRTIIQPAGWYIKFGPVMGGISQHFDKMCVVRGMTMDTVAHEIGRMYFITGMTPRGTNPAGSAVGTRIVAQQGDQTPMPNLVSRVDTYNE